MSVNVDTLWQAQNAGIVLGVVPPSGRIALRLEIDEMLKDTPLANLYFLALEALQKASTTSDVFSFYEIAGIHGRPDRPWDGVPDEDQITGYCSHGKPTFPTWHRVYLAQYEQALYLQAAQLAPALNAQSVLERFRIPYFDPFAARLLFPDGSPIYGLPVIFTLPKINVQRRANGPWEETDNPLYKFNLPRKPGDFVGSSSTVRGGSTFNHIGVLNTLNRDYNPGVDHSRDRSFQPSRSDAAQTLWRSLLDRTGQDWLNMSNHNAVVGTDPDRNGITSSIESFHDNIHGDLGGSMGSVAVAGFDPSFWLHHCNVDRLLSIWQGIRSNDSDATKWWQANEVPRGEGPADPLRPFRRAGTRQNPVWWTSNETKDTRKMGYDYPETSLALQSGNVVNYLTSWAHNTLGRFSNDRVPFNQSHVTALTEATTIRVPFWPQTVAFDGNRPYSTWNLRYLGSNPAPTAPRALAAESRPMMAMAMAAAPVPAPALAQAAAMAAPALAAKAESMPETKHVPELTKAATSDDFKQKVMEKHFPENKLTVEERCGVARKLVCHNKMTQWEICFTVDKFCLDGSFEVIFFLGDFQPEANSWSQEYNIAGASYIFASDRQRTDSTGGCASCKAQKEEQFKYGDAIALTQPLLTYYQSQEEAHGHKITNLDPEAVVPFLTRELHWRIVKANGEEVPREEVPSLKVGVYSETVHIPSDVTQAPTFENKVLQYGITAGRPNGMNPGDSWV